MLTNIRFVHHCKMHYRQKCDLRYYYLKFMKICEGSARYIISPVLIPILSCRDYSKSYLNDWELNRLKQRFGLDSP